MVLFQVNAIQSNSFWNLPRGNLTAGLVVFTVFEWQQQGSTQTAYSKFAERMLRSQLFIWIGIKQRSNEDCSWNECQRSCYGSVLRKFISVQSRIQTHLRLNTETLGLHKELLTVWFLSAKLHRLINTYVSSTSLGCWAILADGFNANSKKVKTVFIKVIVRFAPQP